MGRKSGKQVQYWASRNAYYCWFRGKQVKLADGPDNEENHAAACRAYGQLYAVGNMDRAGDENTVAVICEAYLQAIDGKRAARTFRLKQQMLQLFLDTCGGMRCSEVKAFHLEQIAAVMRQPRKVGNQVCRWGDRQTAIFYVNVGSAFTWAMRKELIRHHPLKSLDGQYRVDMPEYKTRSRERIVTADEHGHVMTLLFKPRHQPLKRIMIALEDTGARPEELYRATVGDFSHAEGVIVYHAEDKRRTDEFRHKNARRGKTRRIMFTGACLEMVRSLCAGRKAGECIFLEKSGKPFTVKSLDEHFRRIRLWTGYKHFVPYCYRHTLSTNFLAGGGSIDVLAELLGNSPETIRKHYSHLLGKPELMRNHLEDFKRAVSGT